jgi:AraC-like DNA-binding protein
VPGDDLIFLHCGAMPACDARVDKHFDGYWTLQFGVSGGVELFYDERRHLLTRETAWFWPAFPGPRIRFHVADGPTWDHRYAAFRGPRVARWVADGLWPEEPQAVPPSDAARYAAEFDRLLAHIRRGDRWGNARAVHTLEGLLLDLAEARSGPTARQPAPEPWLSALLDDGTADDFAPDFAAVARGHGMALATLRRRFREATGTALHEYVLQRRIARARALLGDTDLPIKAVAERLGYQDVYFFTRQFRQRVGVPPAAYRRSRPDRA